MITNYYCNKTKKQGQKQDKCYKITNDKQDGEIRQNLKVSKSAHVVQDQY